LDEEKPVGKASSAGMDTPVLTESRCQTVAPAWHTLVVLLVLTGFAFATGRAQSASPIGVTHSRVVGYLVIMVFEWAMVGFIWFGVRLHGLRLVDVIGGSWARPVAVLRDFGIAIGFLVIAMVILSGLGHLLKAVPGGALRDLLPRSSVQVFVFLLLTLTAGFCEEVIFRGYLQRQFTALTSATVGGIVLQGIVFGAAHAYQGWKYVVLIVIFGWMFGLLAHWRRSLRPGMVAHFLQDGVGGLVASHVFH
jgi:membrane protease YdiL (CAAX protease family)